MLKTSYLRAAILPSVIAFLCNVAYGAIDAAFSNYKSDFMTAGGFVPVMILIGLINSAIIMVLSLPIFLNYYPQVKHRIILSALVWVFCPMIWLGILTGGSKSDLFDFSEGLDSPGISVVLNTVPYIVASILSFIRFRRNLKSVVIPGVLTK